DSLPVFLVEVGPAGGAGERWGDAIVEAAARTAGYLRRHQHLLKLTRFQATKGELILSTAAGTRVVWGHAPNAESTDEAPAAEKLQRLLDYCARHGDLDQPPGRAEHDVRPAVLERDLRLSDPPLSEAH